MISSEGGHNFQWYPMVSNGIRNKVCTFWEIMSTSRLNNQPLSGNRSDSGTCKIETGPCISESVVYNISYLTGKSFGWIRYGHQIQASQLSGTYLCSNEYPEIYVMLVRFTNTQIDLPNN